MNKNKEKSNNFFDVNTPLEYVGFGFLVMIIVGAFFAAYMCGGGTSYFEAFADAIWIPYFFVAGPFIIFGISKQIEKYSENSIFLKRVTVNTCAVSHYIALFLYVFLEVSSWICFFTFFAAYFLSPVATNVFRKIKSKHD